MNKKENTCYYCGKPCLPDKHFCLDEEYRMTKCGKEFFAMFQNEKFALTELARITRDRKNKKINHFVRCL